MKNKTFSPIELDYMRAREDNFRNLWMRNADEYSFFELAKEYNPNITFTEFDHAWQYCTVLNPSIWVARKEFALCFNGSL